MCYDKNNNFTMTVNIQGKNWNGSAWVDTQIQGTNTNGLFQIIPPNNMPDGKYGIEVRALNIGHFNNDTEVHIVKVYLPNMPQINGYNNTNQSNNTLYFSYVPSWNSTSTLNTLGFYHEGSKDFNQVVGGIGQLKNGLIYVKITDEKDVPITIGANHTWIMTLDFKKID